MTYPEFEARWQHSGGAERANYGLFLQDLCDLLGVPRPDPTTDDPAHDHYVLERAVTFADGPRKSTGRIDLYKRGCFVLETKQGTDTPNQQQRQERAELGLEPSKRRKGHAVRNSPKWAEMMQAARQQALGYVRALPPSEPRPLFVLVADVGYCLDVYSNFAGVGDSFVPFPDQTKFRIKLTALADDSTRAMLRQIWLAPRELDASRRAARVTRELAGRLAKLSEQLEQAGHAPEVVAQFLMRCLFTMFSEDTGLIPKTSFTGMLTRYGRPELLEFLPDALQTLWRTMDTGGFSPDLQARLRRFNGRLFHAADALPLSAAQAELLLQSARADWTEVEPAIFGTLLERALDPRERHSLGAHYTPRRYVERLVLPTVLEPLRREWSAAQAAAARRLAEGQDKDARAELVRFLQRLTSLRILDPACGSGNFLYVTLEHLKRLEGEVLAAINSYGQTGLLELGGGTTVSPHQLLGLELNPRAAAIADVVLRIGYLQWHLRTYGPSELREPLLDEYQNIRQQDAALQHDPPVPRLDAQGQPVTRWDGTTRPHPATGQPVPDETARTPVLDYPNPRPAEWPQADFIVGNPPFVGPARMRDALGDGYTEALRKAYKGKVPDSADLVMYWWYNAAATVQRGAAERFGFITTNSLKQTFNRRVMQPFLEGDPAPLTLTFAVPDHPWVDAAEGAAVRIAMTVAERTPATPLPGQLWMLKTEDAAEGDEAADVTFDTQEGRILPDLSIGAAMDSAGGLKSNDGLSSRGVQLMGAGFIVSHERALELGLESNPASKAYIRTYSNGRDLTDRPRGVMVIDLFGLTSSEVLEQFPAIYQHVAETVKPERDQNNRASYRDRWWIFGEARSGMRSALKGLPRYIATVETAKHRLFQFLDASVLPDNMVVAIALDDAFHLGVLSSRIHRVWALTAGGTLEDRPRYNKSRCFDPFPFPEATAEQQARIRELAEQLDAHRKRQQALHPTLTLTDLYNVVEKLRAGQPLATPKEQLINQQGLASVVLSLHQQLDVAVAAAYGWPAALPEPELLARLVALNHARAQQESLGHVQYLRPAYQAPELQQSALALPAAAARATAATAATGPQPWPAELAQQMQALRDTVQQAGQPLSAAQVAARFRRTPAAKVQPLLATLVTLSLLRETDDGLYAG
ncbi:class I SAM-dependent DNA methyltransferase [Hymenobacter psychrophilus]|uniref:site-specific DNA-methyltransferase (adenine-specific) n=1 Tax=Hymenobacter psychrophilus TaxID=651662 RepID=A0A1H3B640_9BACT|nr:DNA methyltransferase [Hymenobacter psychrophilus]SDX36884.1 Type II restriction/modification system, DNA methylase subunit YeeA [Hymenobacter psychrophilus]